MLMMPIKRPFYSLQKKNYYANFHKAVLETTEKLKELQHKPAEINLFISKIK
jgi:hypothetical protein